MAHAKTRRSESCALRRTLGQLVYRDLLTLAPNETIRNEARCLQFIEVLTKHQAQLFKGKRTPKCITTSALMTGNLLLCFSGAGRAVP